MAKIARKEDKGSSAERGAATLSKTAQSATREGAESAREGTEHARTSATEAAANGRQIVQRSAGESAEQGWSLMELLGEQTRHNIQVAAAFRQPMNWEQASQLQRAFMADSFHRMTSLGARYRRLLQAGVTSMAAPPRR